MNDNKIQLEQNVVDEEMKGNRDQGVVDEEQENSHDRGRNGTSIFDDLEKLRKDQNFADAVGAKRVMTRVPVGPPSGQVWFRVHPNAEWQVVCTLLKYDESGEIYFVAPDVAPEVSEYAHRANLRTLVTPQGNVRLWDNKFPKGDRPNSWLESARKLCSAGETRWVQKASNFENSAYDIRYAPTDFGEPKWPSEGFEYLLKLAFADRIIESIDHSVVARLLGRKP